MVRVSGTIKKPLLAGVHSSLASWQKFVSQRRTASVCGNNHSFIAAMIATLQLLPFYRNAPGRDEITNSHKTSWPTSDTSATNTLILLRCNEPICEDYVKDIREHEGSRFSPYGRRSKAISALLFYSPCFVQKRYARGSMSNSLRGNEMRGNLRHLATQRKRQEFKTSKYD